MNVNKGLLIVLMLHSFSLNAAEGDGRLIEAAKRAEKRLAAQRVLAASHASTGSSDESAMDLSPLLQDVPAVEVKRADVQFPAVIPGVAYAWEDTVQERAELIAKLQKSQDSQSGSADNGFELVVSPTTPTLQSLAAHVFYARTVEHVKELESAGVTGEDIGLQSRLAIKVVAQEDIRKVNSAEKWSAVQVATYYAARDPQSFESSFLILDFLCGQLQLPLNHQTSYKAKKYGSRIVTAYSIVDRFADPQSSIKELFDTYQGLAAMNPGKARDKSIRGIQANAVQEGGFCGIKGLALNLAIKYQ